MGYGRGSSGKRYRIVPPEGVSGLLEPWRRRLPTFEDLAQAKAYAKRVHVSMGLTDCRTVSVFLGKDRVGEWTINGWIQW